MTKMIVDTTSNQYAVDPKDLWSEKAKEQQCDQLEVPRRNETQQGLKKPENHLDKDI